MTSRLNEKLESDYDERMEVHAGELVPKEAARFEHNDAQGGLTAELRGRFRRRKSAEGSGGCWIAVELEVGVLFGDDPAE